MDKWDRNEDSSLNSSEFSAAIKYNSHYNKWDTNADLLLTEDEWNNGINAYNIYSSGDLETFDDWNTNRDDVLTKDEFINGLFDTIDTDDDGLIGLDEYKFWHEHTRK